MTYRVGDPVRVANRPHDGHHRTPSYLKGKRGVVARVHGSFRNPETRAYGGDGLPKRPLYQVELAPDEVWPAYRGRPGDRILVDVYAQWLEQP